MNKAEAAPQIQKRVTILGATGTIGKNTLDIISRNKDAFKISALTGNQNISLLAKQAKEFGAQFVATADENKYSELKTALAGSSIECGAGEQAIHEAASREADICMASIVGVAGLRPTLKAMETTPIIGLANKECLVSAGSLFMKTAQQFGTHVIPVDSEHSGAYQCLKGEQPENIKKLTLTASGGPFRSFSMDELKDVTKVQALKHPNWVMGEKITIDSATMMNKGLELIEASFLFSLRSDQLDMVIHPQSVIHCLLACRDGSTLAQLSEPDMRIPIAYSLSWPNRMVTPLNPIDLVELGSMTFEKGDETRFPCLRLAKEVLENNPDIGPILNAANEIAVAAFLSEKCSFMAIPELIETVIDKMDVAKNNHDPLSLNNILNLDGEARRMALELLKHLV